MNRVLLNERIDKYGTDPLLDEEAIFLLTGIPILKIRKWIIEFGIKDLLKFIDTMGLTSNQKKKLQLLYTFNERMDNAYHKEKDLLYSSQKSGEYCIKLLQHKRTEQFILLLLDSQNRLIRMVPVSKGTINEAAVYPREVVQTVINHNAVSVVLAHNHPGGSDRPSNSDIEVTKKLQSALSQISVRVIDHIIVHDSKYFSMAENNMISSL